jgi:truncated hemoglobin YjbI
MAQQAGAGATISQKQNDERAEAWFGKWRECMDEMVGLAGDMKERLLGKMTQLAHKLTANKRTSS